MQYLSRSTGQWIPAVVQGHVMLNSELHYHLDVQEAAPSQRVKSAAVTLPDELPMAPTIAALDVLERGEETLRKEKREVEVKDVDVETPSMFTFASGKMLQKSEDETLEDSIALRVASTARPKAKAAGKGQFSESEGGTLPTPARVEPSLQDLKSFLERVERPSNLFSQKTFLDEPHFGLEISKHGTLPDAELSELSVSLPVGRNLPDDSNRCFQEMEKPPEPGGSGSSRVERLSEIFSRKTFLDEPRFGLSTSESLVDGQSSSETYRSQKKRWRALASGSWAGNLLGIASLRLEVKVSQCYPTIQAVKKWIYLVIATSHNLDPQKVAKEGKSLFSGKSFLVKYSNLARIHVSFTKILGPVSASFGKPVEETAVCS